MPTPRAVRRPRHIVDTYYDMASDDPATPQIWAYTGRMSYRAGETLELHVDTTCPRYDVEIGRDGLRREVLHRERGLEGVRRPTPDDCSSAGCGWPVSWRFAIPWDWRPGGYSIALTARRGGETVEYHHVVVVRSAEGSARAPAILLCATGTWVAYNDWGGSNAYDGVAGPGGDRFSPVLSTQRPWSRGFARLPEGAPRTTPETTPPAGACARYPYMEWAFANGYSKKYASAGWASYERHMARWLEAEGVAFDVATLHDLHAEPDLLDGHRCALFVGHDEYWSRAMRDAVDAWVDAGGRAARFAGNFFWQIRLEDGGRAQVCHKYAARAEDPAMGTADEACATTCWEAPEVGHPGARTFGVNGSRGVYAGFGRCVGRGPGGFVVYRPGHWAFEGAHLGYGDVLGAASRVFGYEVDGLDHVVRDGLPFPTGADGAPDGLEILAMGLASNVEADFGPWGEDLYIGDLDRAFLAEILYGDASPESLDRAGRGNGAIVTFARGRGEVFTAGCCEWVNGLRLRDPQIERVTRNVLRRFAAA